MSSTATRRVSAALATLAVSALLVLPASPAVATPVPVATRSQASPAATAPNATAPSVLTQSWRFLADLLGWPSGTTPDSAARRRGLISRHSDLGGFIDPDGVRTLSQTPGTLVIQP